MLQKVCQFRINGFSVRGTRIVLFEQDENLKSSAAFHPEAQPKDLVYLCNVSNTAIVFSIGLREVCSSSRMTKMPL
jgi:hypothetical protein